MFRPRTLCQMKPAPEEQNINPHKSSLPGDYFTRTPTYDGKPKEFPSKTKKPLQLTTKAYLVQKIDRKGVEDIQPKEQMIDFNKLLLQFVVYVHAPVVAFIDNAHVPFETDAQLLHHVGAKVLLAVYLLFAALITPSLSTTAPLS